MQRTASAEATRLMSQTSGPIAPLRAPVEKRFAGNRPPDNTEQVPMFRKLTKMRLKEFRPLRRETVSRKGGR